MESREWLQKVAADKNGKVVVSAISKRAHIANSTLTDRLNNPEGLTVDQVIAICRAYSYPFTQGLLDLGFITEADLRLPAIQATLRDATDQQLVDEISRRLDAGNRAVFDRPIRPVPQELSEGATKLPPVEELAANPHQLDPEQGDHIE
ncbi:hypothetical protein QP858_06695 [Trueperella bernardiae]|uniref:HTH cro/C1-type domain-containing protein n=1 Tax=Trueperella bernardiae TaxID=59561 RepID=A0AAW6ZK64_9ACTO|nr:hypothetical protein [Trueperella bernardiae]MDK8602141.1 hypothetical protein [Trueperella bernardiae]